MKTKARTDLSTKGLSLAVPSAAVLSAAVPSAATATSALDRRRARLIRAANHQTTPPAGNSALIAAELGAVRCRWCNDDLEHCHDALVVHAVGEVHCMGASCSTPPELHHMVVDCDDFGCTCAQTGNPQAGVSQTA